MKWIGGVAKTSSSVRLKELVDKARASQTGPRRSSRLESASGLGLSSNWAPHRRFQSCCYYANLETRMRARVAGEGERRRRRLARRTLDPEAGESCQNSLRDSRDTLRDTGTTSISSGRLDARENSGNMRRLATYKQI